MLQVHNISKLIIGALIFASVSFRAHALEVGDTAPQFSLIDSEGASVQLADFDGKLIYLDFWASWCGPCRQSFPWMNDMHAKYSNKGLSIVAVNVDQKTSDAEAFLKDFSPNFTVLLDSKGKTPALYEVPVMPTSFLISPEGKVLFKHIGFQMSKMATVESEISSEIEALK